MLRVVDDKKKLSGDRASDREMIQLARSAPASRAAEILEKLRKPGGEFNLYREAYSRGVNATQFLEMLDPSKDHGESHLDAFQRLLRASGIKTTSDHTRGILCDPFEKFDEDDATRALIPEFLARCYRAAVFDNEYQRASSMYLSTDYLVGGIMRPFATRSQVVRPTIAAAIPLGALVAITTGIDGDTYRGFYIDDEGEDTRRMKRIGESAEIPRLRIRGREQTIKLHKYGGAIEMSYESLRRLSIDMVAVHIQMIAAQAEVDKVADAVDIIVSGDGNNNAITSLDLTDLDADATVGELSLKAWLAYEMEFENPYAVDVILTQKGPALQVRMLNTGSANISLQNANQPLLGQLNNVRLLNRTAEGLALGWLSEAPANKLVGFDSRVTLERVYEIGGSISETERFILRQTEALTFTEVEGFGIIDANGRKALNLAA